MYTWLNNTYIEIVPIRLLIRMILTDYFIDFARASFCPVNLRIGKKYRFKK